ncbi:reverse transcriptase domain-containing protein [Tanacetum coccineum]
MPPTMMNQSASRPAAASRGGGTGGRVGRGGGRTRGHSGDQGDGRIDGQDGQVGGEGGEVNDSVNGVPDFSTIIAQQNQNGDAINDNIRVDISRGCTYKEFLACNPKDYDCKGGAIAYTRWIEKIESVQVMSGCRDSQKVKYNAGLFIGMSWEDFKTFTREEFCPSNEMQKLETELWNYVMVGAGHAAYTDRFHELARLVPHLVTPEGKRIQRYVYGLASQIRGMVAATEPKTIQKAMQIAGTLTDEALRNGSIKKNPEKRGHGGEPSRDRNVRDDNKRTRTGIFFATTANPVRREYTGHFAKDYRVTPRNVNPVNARNLVARTCYECGSTDHIKSACPRAFMLGADEACQDPNIVMGTFTLNDHYANRLFDFGADYSFVSTTFIPLLGIEPSDLGMDWLSGYKAEIICHEKVVRIPLLDGKVLRVLREKPEEKIRQLMSAKAKEKKQEELVVVKDFPEVFPDDLSGLPPVREIELVPRAMPVAKSPYRLAPSELEELSSQLKELQDKASIQNLETKFDRLADKQSGRPFGSLPSNTQPNPKGHNSKAYQPPQSRNEHVNAVFTGSGKSYNPSVNPNDQQNDSETPINFDSDDEDEESTPQLVGNTKSVGHFQSCNKS